MHQATDNMGITKSLADWAAVYNEYLDAGGAPMDFEERRTQFLKIMATELRLEIFKNLKDFTSVPQMKEWVRVQVEYEVEWDGNDAAANVDDGRNEPSPHCLHEETIVSTRRLDHFRGFTGVERERLLAHDVFAGVERGHRHIVVFAVRRRDIDDVDVRVSAEISV